MNSPGTRAPCRRRTLQPQQTVSHRRRLHPDLFPISESLNRMRDQREISGTIQTRERVTRDFTSPGEQSKTRRTKKEVSPKKKPGSAQGNTPIESEPEFPCPVCSKNMLPAGGLSISSAPCGDVICTDCIETLCRENKVCPLCSMLINTRKVIRIYL